MRNILSFKHCLFGLFLTKNKSRASSGLAFLLSLSLTSGWNPAQAASPQTAPPRLKNLLAQIDAAANKHDINAVLQFYSQNFTNTDGLTRSSMAKALTQLWQRYPNLKYQTQLQSWKPQGNDIIAETVTNITATQAANSSNMAINSTIKSQQRLQGVKIVRQDILAERSQLTTGAKPPTVEVKLPQQVKTGQQYNFDVVVQEPLGTDYLLGAALEEPVQADKYFKPTPVEWELLPAGGIFKVGRAPAKADNRWVSAILIRSGGMTVVTQRLVVSK